MQKKISNKKLTWILVALFVAISFYPLFAFLGSQTIRIWDESRVAISAYEMTKTKNPLIVTFEYQPDHWSVKPPLAVWIQAISIKLFGMNETAVRLPSALAIMFLGVIIIFLTGVIKKPFLGLYASTIMICSNAFYYYHTARTADYDALLCFFVVSYLLLFFIYTETAEKKYYKLFFLALILASLTKGVQALMPLPFIPIYLLFRKQLIPILKNKTTYIGIVLFILFVGGYYIAREFSYRGYLNAVSQFELGGRFLKAQEGNGGRAYYYFEEFQKGYFTYFLPLVPLAFIFNLFIKDKQAKRLSIYSIGISMLIYLLLSIAKTKLIWYALPVVPLFSIAIGVSLYVIHNWIMSLRSHIPDIYALIIVGYIAFFFIPYNEIVQHIYRHKEVPWFEAEYSRLVLMQRILKKDIVLNDTINYIHSGDYSQNENLQNSIFYFHAMTHYNIPNVRKKIKDLKIGDIVQINEIKTDEEIRKKFEYDVMYFHIQSKIVRLTKLVEKQNL